MASALPGTAVRGQDFVAVKDVIDFRPGQASALNSIGWFHAKLADHEAALAYCQRAHELFRQLGDRIGEAATWDSLGYAHHQLGRYADAIQCYRHAVDMFRAAGDRYHEAESLANLSTAYLAAADTDHAYGHAWSAVRILDALGHPDAAEVRRRLAPQLLTRQPR